MGCQPDVYDKQNRMQYHPEFHTKHGEPYSESEKEYLCKYFEADGAKSIQFALDRTEISVAHKVGDLRRQGLFEYYKNLNKYW